MDQDRPFPPAAARELHRKTLLLIAAFLVVHFLLLTLRIWAVGLENQAEIARARAVLVPFGAVLCYLIYLALLRWRGQGFVRQVVVAALLSALAATIHGWIWARFLADLNADQYPGTLIETVYQALYWHVFYFSWTTAYLALCYSITVREQARQASAWLAEAQDAKIRALRYQINPHFLFNTLNSIATLIGEDSDRAEAMVLSLSEFFRTSLAVDPLDDVRLADEIALQRLYLQIERVRFPDRLAIRIELPAELAGALVPSLILQPLVENAVKHGVARSEAATEISIRAAQRDDRLCLVVADDAAAGGMAPPLAAGTGVGLANVRSRLQTLYGAQASLHAEPRDGCGFEAVLELPLRF